MSERASPLCKLYCSLVPIIIQPPNEWQIVEELLSNLKGNALSYVVSHTSPFIGRASFELHEELVPLPGPVLVLIPFLFEKRKLPNTFLFLLLDEQDGYV